MHEGRLCGMSIDYGKAKEDKKRLNEEINVLERKFKYAGLRMSHGLPRMNKKAAKGIVLVEASSERSPKEGHSIGKYGQGKGC